MQLCDRGHLGESDRWPEIFVDFGQQSYRPGGRSTLIPDMSMWDNSANQLQPFQTSAWGNQWPVQAHTQGGGWGQAGQGRRGGGGYGGGGGGQRRGVRFPPANTAHDPYVPNFLSSIIMVDGRDIITNSSNSVNAQFGLLFELVRQLHAQWCEGHVRGFCALCEWRSMRMLGWPNRSGALPPSILAIFMANAQARIPILCGREGLQRE